MERFEHVARQLDSQLVSSEKLIGGSSAEVYALDLVERRVIFRQHRSNDLKGHRQSVTAKEFRVMSELHNRELAVAAPLLYNEDEAWLVTEWIEGTSTVDPHELPSALDQMVEFLVALHQLNVQDLGIDCLGDLEDPMDVLADQAPASPAGDRLRVALERGCVDRVANAQVLIHGDYWPGNVLWHGGKLAAVIDWEDAQRGDPLADLACARVELLCQYGADAMRHFTDRYLAKTKSQNATSLNTTSLPLWEAYVSATALATMHRWGLAVDDERHRRRLTTNFFDRAVADLLS